MANHKSNIGRQSIHANKNPNDRKAGKRFNKNRQSGALADAMKSAIDDYDARESAKQKKERARRISTAPTERVILDSSPTTGQAVAKEHHRRMLDGLFEKKEYIIKIYAPAGAFPRYLRRTGSIVTLTSKRKATPVTMAEALKAIDVLRGQNPHLQDIKIISAFKVIDVTKVKEKYASSK